MKITEYKKKNGATVYRSQVYLGIDVVTGKKVKTSVSARTKKEVKLLATQKKYDFKQNGSTIYKSVNIDTFDELTNLWLESYKLTVKPQSYRNTISKIDCHIRPYFGHMKLNKINASMIQVFINDLSKKQDSFVMIRSIISRILQQGVLLNLIPSNPARDIILPRKKHKDNNKVKFIDKEDLKKFLDHIEKKSYGRYGLYFDYVLYNLLLATGLRIGEACALEWSDIDLENGTIAVTKTFNKSLKIISTTKTKSGTRNISIGQDTVNLMKLYKARQRQLFSEISSNAPRIVFSTPTRDYFDNAIRQCALDTMCNQAGVARFTFHAFRHTHASLLLNAGISYKELQYRLGHSNIAMTLDTYSHLSKDKEKEAVSYFEKAMNGL